MRKLHQAIIMSANDPSVGTSTIHKSLAKAYRNEQSFSKAVDHAQKALPNSP
jgi:hypothetical protein